MICASIHLSNRSFLCGDPQTQWTAHEIAIETGVLYTDEVWNIEDWNWRKKPEIAA